MKMVNTMLEVNNLSKSYGDKKVVCDLSMTVEDGDIMGFIGKNGAGKTTTLKCCLGIISFDQGEVLLDGVSILKSPVACKKMMAYVPDNPVLDEYMTGIQYLNFIDNIYRVPLKERKQEIERLAAAFQMEHHLNSLISSYSHGMKQKLALIGRYSIIYADPPWRYTAKKIQGAAENHYPTMSISELCALPVADLAAKDSALFLWATFPQLPEALRLIQAWGFTYKSVAFVWLKQNRKSPGWFYGLGFWTRGNAEVCLLATRGHPKRQAANVHQFIISPIREHSRKPEEAREKIVALMGDLPRVELFARQSPPGWDVWGNEVEPTIPDFWTKCPEAAGQKEVL